MAPAFLDRRPGAGRARAPAGAAGLVALLVGCRAPTQVTLVLSTDVPCGQTEGTAILLGGATSEDAGPGTVAPNCTLGSIGTLVLVPGGAKDAAFTVQAVLGVGIPAQTCVTNPPASPPPGEGCISATRSLSFVPYTPLELPVVLHAECLGVKCLQGQTCVAGGVCSSDQVSDPSGCSTPGGCSEENLGDGGAGACALPCDPVKQCGCPAGDACTLADGGLACAPPGALTAGSLCGAKGGCVRGEGCDAVSTELSLCRKFCREDTECPSGGHCVEPIDGALTGANADVRFCSEMCDPPSNKGCPSPALACGVGWVPGATKPDGGAAGAGDAGAPVYTQCEPAGQIATGGSCDSKDPAQINGACVPGDACVASTCRLWCDVATTTCPAPGGGASGHCGAVTVGPGFPVAIGGHTFGVCY